MIVFFLFPSIHEPPSFLPFPFSLSFPFYSRDLSSLSPLEYQLIQALFSSQLISRFVSFRLIKGRNVILVSYSLFDERWIFLPWDNRETRRKPRPRAASCPGYSRVRRGRANVQECVNVGYTRDLRCAQPTKRLHRLIHRVFSPRKWKCSDDAFVKLPRMHLLRDGNEDEPGRAITGQTGGGCLETLPIPPWSISRHRVALRRFLSREVKILKNEMNCPNGRKCVWNV